MRRDRNRDYATDAFQFHAQTGGYDAYAAKLHDRLIREAAEKIQQSEPGGSWQSSSSAVEAAKAAYDRLYAEHTSELEDLWAVKETMDLLELLGGHRDKCEAVKQVYFRDPMAELDGEAIHGLVHAAEINIPASERSIYRWLFDARAIFAWKRGLRVTATQIRSLQRMRLL